MAEKLIWSKEAQSLKIGEYEHYKGRHYKVIGIARHSETLEEMVVYQESDKRQVTSDKANDVWARPLKMFLEEVIAEGKKKPRFRFIG